MNAHRALWAYVLAVAAAALCAYPLLVRDYGPFETNDYWAALLLFVATPAAESLVVHFRFHRSAHSFSLLELPLTVGILTTSPLLVVLAYGLGSGLVLRLRRRQPPIKLVFNTATFVLTATVAEFIFSSIPHPHSTFSEMTWLAVGTSVMTASALGTALVIGVITVAERKFQTSELPKSIAMGLMTASGGISIGIAAAMLASSSILAVLFITTPLLALFAANRAYESEHQRRESLQVVFDTSRTLTEEPESETALLQVLERCYQSMPCDFVAIYLEYGPESFVRLLVDGEGRHRTAVTSSIVRPLLDLAALRGQAWSMLRDEEDATTTSRNLDIPSNTEQASPIQIVRDVTDRQAVAAAFGAPLMDGNEVIGIVIVGEYRGSLKHLGHEDRELFETVCRAIGSHTRLTREAHEDPLTGLPNRRRLTERLETLFGLESVGHSVLMFIDLDDFKGINDTLGHEIGDGVLRAIGDRLKRILPAGWLAARLGGDEFAVLGGHDSVAEGIAFGEEILATLSSTFTVGPHVFQIRASVGLAVAADAESPAHLLRNADTALYEAKGLGKGQLMVFNQPMHARAARRYRLGEALRQALDQDELHVVFQPVVNLGSGAIIGVEALVRWQDSEFGQVPTDEFVEIAEQQNLSAKLAMRVLAAATEGMSSVPGAISVSMNVSPGDLGDADFVLALLRARETVLPHSLGIEITERMLLSDPRIRDVLGVLRNEGIRVYVDDFGTGYSSLAYLKDLPVDYLKIPREFVRDIERDSRTLAVVRGVVALGKALGLTVVAEGIETSEQRFLVTEAGAALGQGYLFDRPLSVIDFRQRMREAGVKEAA